MVVSRIVKRRSVAQEFCEKGRVHVNKIVAKSSKEIKHADEIQLKRSNEILTVRVLKLPDTKQIAKADADTLVDIISVEKTGERSD